MMALPFVAHSNVYVVPTLPRRLAFAVLVRRAFAELQCGSRGGPFDRHDMILVSMPASIRQHVEQAVARLPALSLVVASHADERCDEREVFPVTPSDGVIEAIRIAIEHHLPLEFIDCELVPARLQGRRCPSDPKWPDDGLAVELGAEEYIEIIRGRVAHPSMRWEPLATWRERHMAERIRICQPQYRRILVVCEATHVEPIMRLLASPDVPSHPCGRSGVARLQLRLWAPSGRTSLRYLDDFPRLVEYYDEHRLREKAPVFDKGAELLQAIRSVAEDSRDLTLSTRHFQAYARLQSNMLRCRRRLCPSPEDLFAILAGCFGEPFAQRVVADLGGYRGQIDSDRIRLCNHGDDQEGGPAPAPRKTRPFVARACDPVPKHYELAPVQPLLASPHPAAGGWHLWQPQHEFHLAMATRARRIAAGSRCEAKAEVFRGSLEAGLDTRRTLSSLWQGAPRLYVRRKVRRLGEPADPDDPIAWLLRTDIGEKGSFSLIHQIRSEPACLTYLLYTTSCEKSLRSSGDTRRTRWGQYASSVQRIGWLMFLRRGAVVIKGKKQGEQPQREIALPLQRDFQHGRDGALSRRLAKLEKAGVPWWELLLLAGLDYARTQLLCVVPAGFRLPARVSACAAGQRKSICCISWDKFSRNERRLLTYWYSVKGVLDEETSTPEEYDAAMMSSYGNIMRRHFGLR